MLFIAAHLNPGTILVKGVQCWVTVHNKCCRFLNHTESRREQIIKAVFSSFKCELTEYLVVTGLSLFLQLLCTFTLV